VFQIKYEEKTSLKLKKLKKQTFFYSSPGRALLNCNKMCELRKEMITGSAQLWSLCPFLSRLFRNNAHLCSAVVICIFLAHEGCGTLHKSSLPLYLKAVFVLFFVISIDLIWGVKDFYYSVTLCKCVSFLENCEAR